MEISLVMFKADSTRREFPIKRDAFVIGRKNTCDLRIPLSSVSRKHCELKIEDGKVVLRDLGSSNGTYLNRTRVEQAVLAAGDEVVVGPVVFTVVVDGKPEVIEPVRSLVEEGGDLDDSAILPSSLLEAAGDGPSGDSAGGSDTISNLGNIDDDDDPISALERLSELEVPDVDLPK
jgi:pSer/pThr/pTyr-binding forkhead associated (FHA) protein